MKLFRKSVLLAALMVFLVLFKGAYAAEKMANRVRISFENDPIPRIVENSVLFELYDETGVINFDSVTHQLRRGENAFEIEFNLPYYPAGTKFRIKADDGVKGIYYNGVLAEEHLLETKSCDDENGEEVLVSDFEMSLDLYWQKEAEIKLSGTDNKNFNYRVTDDEIYVTLDLIESLGIKYEPRLNEKKPYFKLYTDSYHYAFLYPDDIYAVFGQDQLNLPEAVYLENGMPYVPLSRVAVYFACNYNLESDDGYIRRVTLTPSVYTEKYKKETFVNKNAVSSKTDYMIWVSKKDFEVNIFRGRENYWTHIKTFPCSIGANATPTIEGQFEYHQKQARWTYPDYYCGPVMRFYRGYAFHSYLIRYNGKPYDSRLGKKISHGCVRMHPDDIGWMAQNIPLYTKVYITP